MLKLPKQMSQVTRNPVFWVSDQVRLKTACSATETSWSLEILNLASVVLYYLSSEQQMCWSDCADAQADLHLCCLHIAKTGCHTMTWLKYENNVSS